MPIDRQRLLERVFPPVRQTYTERDVWLYALCLGLSATDPSDLAELAYTGATPPAVLPSFATVLADPGFWWSAPDTGIDWRRLVHYRQAIEIRSPLPATGTVVGSTRIDEVFDRGEGKGAIYRVVRDLHTLDKVPLATVTAWVLGRGDGGFGGPPPEPVPGAVELPASGRIQTRHSVPRHAALLFRLQGDVNPLHSDPRAAAAAGFPRPILHGMCTFGIAGWCMRPAVAAMGGDACVRISARFVAPVYPGDTLCTEAGLVDGAWRFVVRCVERRVLVLDNGTAGVPRN